MKLDSNNRIALTFNDVINVLLDLSYSQGFYGRLLRDINELRECDPYGFENFVNEIEAQEFHSSLDVVLYFEC